jgi:penicillin-binding protein 2
MSIGYPSSSRRGHQKFRVKSRLDRGNRAAFLLGFATFVLSLPMLRLVQLQIVQGSYNRDRAQNNSIRPIPIVSDRGQILDRKGLTLAANQVSRSLYLYPREQTKAQWKVIAEQRLSKILNLPSDKILAEIEKAGYGSAIPVRIFRNLQPQAFIALAEGEHIPGLEIQSDASRVYPNGAIAAHLMGYIGEATEEDMKKHPDFPSGMIVGQMGVERMADDDLRGKWGNRLIEVNAMGKELKVLGIQNPIAGQPLQLTLDLKLQKAAETALAGRRGAAVVIDVKTGGILAMASGPTFDPNVFTRKISEADWNKLQGTDQPLLNRALQPYPPASTFKIISTIAALESGKYQPDSTIMTSNAINVGGAFFHEHGSGYGLIGFKEAMAVSSNTFFYQVGLAVGPEELRKWGRNMGITTSPMKLDGESEGYLPTPASKEKYYKEPWYGGDTVMTAIGQGLVQVTPLEMAVMIAAVANGGKRVKPHLMSHQSTLPQFQPEAVGLQATTLKILREGLESVVKDGTGRQLNDGSIPLTAGKTGTAEVSNGADTGLYVGYGPVKDPQIAVAVVVENGGYGATSAVPIAHAVYKAYFGPMKPAAKPDAAKPDAPKPNAAKPDPANP